MARECIKRSILLHRRLAHAPATERPIALPPSLTGAINVPVAERLKLARRHVAKCRQIIERQQLIVRNGALNNAEALELLALFETTQAIFEDDLDRLLREESAQLSTPRPCHIPGAKPKPVSSSLSSAPEALSSHGRGPFVNRSRTRAAHLNLAAPTHRPVLAGIAFPRCQLGGGARVRRRPLAPEQCKQQDDGKRDA